MSKTSNNEAKWIQPPKKLNLSVPYIKAIPLRPVGDNKIEYEISTDGGPVKVQIQNDKTYLMSNGSTYEDMCNMDILNEPEVLNNLILRYKQDKIFTFIGPTLVVVNPYRVIPEFFSNQAMSRIRAKILQGNTNSQKPHVYLIAGNAFNSMVDQGKKQAIVISGQSGAGKTQSTKYCMQILTSLSHKQAHPIQKKILACNPILQAFGNSKTTRNDNSSRFGKYVQIYFDKNNQIMGANINSYLLEKSRVVATAEKQRNFHIFYALIASGTIPLSKIETYKYLERSKCYQANGIDDKQFFNQIRNAMGNIGFSDQQQNKIWLLLSSILQLGNLEFDDKKNQQHQSKPCQFDEKNRKILQRLSKLLNIKQQDLEKILLFEKKQILKQLSFSPYNKSKCIANANTLSKAIYNAIFQFIIYKIEKSLKPQGNYNLKDFLSINILDIFGFENFDINSFEQFCINYTNQKLLKLYNQYVFERQMKILKQDGLDQHISAIKAPTNQAVIETMAGKVSLFSIINDYTMPLQFKQSDMILGFQSKVPKTGYLEFDKLNKQKFIIIHSQCNVKYNIEGFKQKNQDKVIPQIANIVNNLFEHQSKEQAGRTLLVKFSKEIDDLMTQLTTSNVHFIRCIKPNEKKIARCVEENYMLTQVRYLGVFQTIQIRKKTFPSRWLYEQFVQRFESLFPLNKGSHKDKTMKIMSQLTKDPKEYLLGNQRIYMNSQLESKLSKKLHEFMKKKVESGKKIWKSYKKYKFKKNILKNLKILSNRIKIWRKIATKYQIQLLKKKFLAIQDYAKQKKEQQKIAQAKKLMQLKKNRQQEQKKQKQQKIQKRKQVLPKLFNKLNQKYIGVLSTSFINIRSTKKVVKQVQKQLPKQKKAEVKDQQLIDNAQNNKKDQNAQKQPMKPPKISAMVEQDLNETVFDDNYSSTQPEKYERNVKKNQKQKDFDIHQSFLNQKSILVEDKSDITFEGTLQVGLFDPNSAKNLKKLKQILADKYKPQYNQKSEDFLSPPSQDGNFKIQDTPNDMMQKIIQFQSKQFFKKVLRKRTNFFGMSKDEDDILVVKNKPLSKSLTMINEEDEKQAIKIFKQLLKVSQQAKLQSVFKQIERFIFLCRNASPQLLNQVLLQLVKQSNTSNELSSIRVVQAMAVFLHLYDPDPDFIMASLNFIFKKLADNSFSERQNQYFRYIYKKMIRKLEKNSEVGYMPIKYQIMALMCKRKISIPIYLSIGSSSHIKVESYETLGDIKIRAMQQLGIDHKRLFPELFTFFQLTNFEGLSEQRPLKQDILVWDLVSYWQRSAQKYTDQNQSPPVFYLVIKIRSVYQCHETDQQSIQLMFGQCFFDLFMGRIRLGLKEVGALAACVKKLKFSHKQAEDYKDSYPQWALQKWSQKQLIKQMCDGVLLLSETPLSETQIKFKFLQVCQKAPLSICLTIITDQQVRIHFRHKMIYLSQNNEVIEQIPIKTITKYADQEDKFIFSVRNQGQNRVIYTEHASICCKYMSMLQDLVTRKIKSQSQSSNKNILQNL